MLLVAWMKHRHQMKKEGSRIGKPLTSSRIRILVFLNSARAKHTSCRCPELKFDPPSSISPSRPPTSFSDTNGFKCDFSSAHQISLSLWASSGSTFILKEPANSSGVCGMIDSLLRRVCRPVLAMSIPSIKILPSAASMILKSARVVLDFPAPVRPQICLERRC